MSLLLLSEIINEVLATTMGRILNFLFYTAYANQMKNHAAHSSKKLHMLEEFLTNSVQDFTALTV